MPTAGISLIREHTEHIKPPRALWVPFPLGRPFGPPGQPQFQTAVLRAALALLERPRGPVLEDYPLEDPSASGPDEAWSCLLPLPPLHEGGSAAERLREDLLLEVSLLRPWYEEGLRRRGRTAFGLSGLSHESVDDMAAFLAGFASGDDPEPPAGVIDPMPAALRYIAEDLKAFYSEAAAEQPAPAPPAPEALARWLYGRTRLADAIYAIRDRFAASDDPRLRQLLLVPRAYATHRPA